MDQWIGRINLVLQGFFVEAVLQEGLDPSRLYRERNGEGIALFNEILEGDRRRRFHILARFKIFLENLLRTFGVFTHLDATSAEYHATVRQGRQLSKVRK